MSHKDAVIEAVRHMPEEVTFEEIIEQLAITAAIWRGEETADARRVISHDEVRRLIVTQRR
jgi:hypothetical protein